jgi:hypothetical protein
VEKLLMRIFQRRREVLAREIEVYIREEDHRLCLVLLFGGLGLGGGREQERSGVSEESEERPGEAFQHEVDLCEEAVGPDVGTPGEEDGVCGLKDADVDRQVRGGQRGNELLWRKIRWDIYRRGRGVGDVHL